MSLQRLYHLLSTNDQASSHELVNFTNAFNSYTPAQLASLATLICLSKRSSVSSQILELIFAKHPRIKSILDKLFLNSPSKGKDLRVINILKKTYSQKSLSITELKTLLKYFDKKHRDDLLVSIWLMLVYKKGLSHKNVKQITLAFKNSGEIFDYRSLPEINNRKMIRRYPTGGVSEKIALIMPSLICLLADEYPIASNFLVARSLGFTGGTWDKLSVIPGFTFPKQGKETIDILKKCNVAMSVTKDSFNPYDNYLYQLRSATGTVDSLPLIEISIASKLLSTPVDYLLLDVRYGDGAFAKNKKEAQKLGRDLKKILSEDKRMKFNSCYTEMRQPSGVAIGNKLELIEAIAILKNDLYNPFLNTDALLEQQKLIKDMLCIILKDFLSESKKIIMSKIDVLFDTGKAIDGFKRILAAHGVKRRTIKNLIENPESLIAQYGKFIYKAARSGKVKYINQRILGTFVNFEICSGVNEFVSVQKNGGGIILKVRLGEYVEKNQNLCEVIATENYIIKNINIINYYLSNCFLIE